jgi:hypothetical protein
MTHDERRALWQQRLDEQQASGLSIVAWCFQQDIAEQRFYAWRRRLTAQAAPPPPATPQWLALDPAVEAGSGLTLHVGAVAITVTTGFDPQLLADVVRVLTVPC